MKNDLVERLTEFALSTNQAKVYLSIAYSTATNVNGISKTTQIHRQDIYKILPKLEEKGLITQTADRPVIIEAIPVEDALNNLIKIEYQKAKHRIKHLKETVKTLANSIEENKKTTELLTSKQEETGVIFLSTDSAIKNKLDASYENAKKQCDLVLNFELLMHRLFIFRKRLKTLSENRVETRILIDITKNQQLLEKLEEILPKTGDFAVKLTAGKITVKPYLIIDHKEIYISTQKKTPLYMPCLLWTNSKDIIHVYEDNFEKSWNSPNTIIIHPKKQLHANNTKHH